MLKIFLGKRAAFLIGLLALTACSGYRYTLHGDNDILKPTKNNDKDFSNGVRVAAEAPDKSGSTAYFIGQNFYTPNNKDIVEAQPNDRPYAAYLYGGTDFKYRKAENIQDTFGVTAGIVGPHAYGEETQNGVHELLGQKTFKGWDNQIHDEFGLILKAERAYAIPLKKDFDLVNTIGGHLGNVFTQAYTGASFRYGYNLPDYFSSPGIIFPRLPREQKPLWAVYLYGGPYARAVAQNIFLDGNTFRDSESIDKKPFVAEGRLGVAAEYGSYRAAYTYIIQASEYEGQESGNDFGEITLSIGW